MTGTPDRILATHVGSLVRPPKLVEFLRLIEGGQRYDSAAYEACFVRYPQGMTHVGVAMNRDQLDAAFERLAGTPAFAGRIALSGPFRPGEPGSVDPRVIQGFVRTDIVSTGFLLAGQQFELQVRID